jgi:hypothetical protein
MAKSAAGTFAAAKQDASSSARRKLRVLIIRLDESQ